MKNIKTPNFKNRISLTGHLAKFSAVILAVLYGTITAAVTKGPFIVIPEIGKIAIRWETDKNLEGKLVYWRDNNSKQEKPAVLRGMKDGKYLYEARADGLTAGSRYYYQVQSLQSKTDIYQFRVPPSPAADISFIAMGDSRSNPEIFRTIVEQTGKISPDLVINMGDLVANGGNFKEWDEYYFRPAAKLIARLPFITALGDHEGDGDNGELFRYYLLNDQSVEKQWFSFDYGPVHFVALDYRHPGDPEMVDWFKKDMKESAARWKIVFMHRPSYNLGGHRSHWGSPEWPRLFRESQTDIVFAGHSHLYERFFPVRPQQEAGSWPVTYITTGGAGAGLYDVVSNAFLAKSASVHHFISGQVRGNRLNLTAFRMDGTVLDSFSMEKSGETYTSAYLEQVKPQERLDLFSGLARAISFTIGQIPMAEFPVTLNFNLSPFKNVEKADCEISLVPASRQAYRMEEAELSLPTDSGGGIPLKIFRKGRLTLSEWGDIQPELRLMAVLKSDSSPDTLMGKAIDYWPDTDN